MNTIQIEYTRTSELRAIHTDTSNTKNHYTTKPKEIEKLNLEQNEDNLKDYKLLPWTRASQQYNSTQ